MEKGIYISKEYFIDLFKENLSGNWIEFFKKTAQRFDQEWQMKVYFCKIYNNRWAFISGVEESIICETKIKINDFLGLIVENNVFTRNNWDDFIVCFRQMFPKIDLDSI